jgi:hypothetical protein
VVTRGLRRSHRSGGENIACIDRYGLGHKKEPLNGRFYVLMCSRYLSWRSIRPCPQAKIVVNTDRTIPPQLAVLPAVRAVLHVILRTPQRGLRTLERHGPCLHLDRGDTPRPEQLHVPHIPAVLEASWTSQNKVPRPPPYLRNPTTRSKR